MIQGYIPNGSGYANYGDYTHFWDFLMGKWKQIKEESMNTVLNTEIHELTKYSR